MKRIAQDIKSGQFSNVYLLYGEEAYLRKQYRDNLKKALVTEEDTMNCNLFSGKEINENEVIDLAETMPFLQSAECLSLRTVGGLRLGMIELLSL